MRIGWDWSQTFGDTSSGNDVKYWQVEFIPYVEAQLFIESIFDIERLYYNNLQWEVPKFMYNYFFSLILNGNK